VGRSGTALFLSALLSTLAHAEPERPCPACGHEMARAEGEVVGAADYLCRFCEVAVHEQPDGREAVSFRVDGERHVFDLVEGGRLHFPLPGFETPDQVIVPVEEAALAAAPGAGHPVHLPGHPVHLPGHPVNLPGPPVNLPGQAVRLPGHPVELPGNAVELPGQAVELPGQAVTLPSHPVLLPGQAVVLPGNPVHLPGHPVGLPGHPMGIGGGLLFAPAAPVTDVPGPLRPVVDAPRAHEVPQRVQQPAPVAETPRVRPPAPDTEPAGRPGFFVRQAPPAPPPPERVPPSGRAASLNWSARRAR